MRHNARCLLRNCPVDCGCRGAIHLVYDWPDKIPIFMIQERDELPQGMEVRILVNK